MADPIALYCACTSVMCSVVLALNATRFYFSERKVPDLIEPQKWEPPLFVKLFAPQLVPQLRLLYEVTLSSSDEVLDRFLLKIREEVA